MRLRARHREEPEIILIPLIDVLLMLLIFFMLATTFERSAELKVDLPEGGEQVESKKQEPLELVINAEGRYFLNGREVVNTGIETLKRALKQFADQQQDVHLSVRAASTTDHQAVVIALDAAGKVGITQISIATMQQDELSEEIVPGR